MKDEDGKDVIAVIQTGIIEYTAPDGTPVKISYTADETGFHPQGDVLPVAPVA